MTGPGRAAGRGTGVAYQKKAGAATDAAILQALATLTRPRGPSAPDIARAIRRNRVGVRRRLNALIEAGLVTEEDRGGSHTFLTLTPLGYAHLAAQEGGAT